MNRLAIKVTGAQGQGVNSVGELCGKGLKRAGYCVFGYREYMSIIKGGYSSYQLDFSNTHIESSDQNIDIAVGFNHHVFENEVQYLKEGGMLLHQTGDWTPPKEIQEELERKKIRNIYLPTDDILRELKAPAILANVLITTVVWKLLGRDEENLKQAVREQFGHKGEKIIAMNMAAIDAGVAFFKQETLESLELPAPDNKWKDHLFFTGSVAMGMGIIHAGCRVYIGYPMTPSSPLLEYIADVQNETGMVIKQAEDEITAAQMMSGANFMGTRAATGTSGGGFDLMTETLSLNGLIENPSVFVLAMRPGPATGLPTWTAQGDLLLAVGAAHGEFARLVVAVSDSQDAFDLMPEAFNYAEEFRTPVVVLTDKHIAEGLYTQAPYNQQIAELRRGPLVTDSKELAKLKSTDYFKADAPDGISKRWLPGSEAETYCAQGDEHDEEGNVDETAENAVAQMEKRMKKVDALRKALPDPELLVADSNTESGLGTWDPSTSSGQALGLGNLPEIDLLIISWGSNKGVICDVMKDLDTDKTIAYLHYTYLWPLKTERLESLVEKAKKTVVIECNYQSQLSMLVRMECGLDISDKILKYDGRPFFYDELLKEISSCIA